jgi:NAD(P)-dependent dehydrogenase (short-subunit alcohol dehydrogenase family)
MKDKMAKILVTGSSGGLGLMTGRLLAEEGHRVVLHARNEARAEAVRVALPQVEAVLVGDLSTLAAMRDVADQANGQGRFDAVIHNVALGYREARRVETVDGLSQIWAVNVLAPYVLTALIHRPDRLVYLSSGMHTGGDSSLDDLQWSRRRWNGSQAYADTKFHDVLLAFGVARRWSDVLSNALTPGWVPTRMGGPSAPDDLKQGHLTQVWLAVSEDPGARVTGCYFYHQRLGAVNPTANDPELQNRLLDYCRELSGIALA